jgi:exo-beta-1,3-glucanase (GH17 family)
MLHYRLRRVYHHKKNFKQFHVLMENKRKINIPYERAICYSGYREGQEPRGVTPGYGQVREDLLILHTHWKYLRLYDCDEHAETVLQVIQKEKLDFRVMLGAYIVAEMNNFGCPWGGVYSDEVLAANKKKNVRQIGKLIEFANKYPDIIVALSAGNEACVDWTDHFVPEARVIEYVKMIKKGAGQPVTFCENYLAWIHKLKNLAEEVDFISIHTYPVWEYKNIQEAIGYTRQNFSDVAEAYPGKPVIITEAGWSTSSDGKEICPGMVSEEFQEIYYTDLMNWSEKERILIFVFEAFDEPWKGSPEPSEPEKHWGLFKVDRTPKRVMKNHSPVSY